MADDNQGWDRGPTVAFFLETGIISGRAGDRTCKGVDRPPQIAAIV
ncbi:hypothetical protein QUB63_02960 [Microcoleus sp. ARI1-B5]